jgi:hypothetical protein
VQVSWRPSSPFDKLRVRTTVGLGSHKILILSLSKEEDFPPLEHLSSTRMQRFFLGLGRAGGRLADNLSQAVRVSRFSFVNTLSASSTV